MNRAIPIVAIISSCLLLHCGPDRLAGGAGAGNPPLATVALTFKASTTIVTTVKKTAAVDANPDGSFTIRDSAGNAVTLYAMEARVEGIDFSLPDSLNCGAFQNLECVDGEISVKGPVQVDLMNGNSIPPLSLIKLPGGLYRKIALELINSGRDPDSGKAWDSAIQNIVIKGRTSVQGGNAKYFVMKLNLRNGLEFGNANGIPVKPDTLNAIALRVNVDGWLRGVEVIPCLDSSPAVSDSTHPQLLQGDDFCGGLGKRIRTNIESSGESNEEDYVDPP